MQTDSHNQPLLQYDRFVETSNHEAVLSGYFDETDELENECDLDLNEIKDEIKDEIKNKYDYEYNDRYNDNYWVNNYIINIDLKKNRYPPRVYLFTGYLDFDKITKQFSQVGALESSKSAINTFTSAFKALITIFNSSSVTDFHSSVACIIYGKYSCQLSLKLCWPQYGQNSH